MLVLGIESTCDETACAIVRNGTEMLSNAVASQMALHAPYGGVIPELASRRHVETLAPLVRQALQEAGVTLEDIDLISVARGPGLVGAILVGLNFAKGLAMGLGKPWVGVNHIEAHLYSALMSGEPIPFPALGVVISGGHTALVRMEEIGQYQVVGETQDDAIGEAFDKVATLLGLPYPGGPQIEALAQEGNPKKYPLKPGRIKGRPLDFSFSGLKTAVLYLVKGQNSHKNASQILQATDFKDVAASFQEAALNDVVDKALLAAEGCKSIVIGGGVSQNQRLRQIFAEKSQLPIFWPPKGLSLDNAAMIAGLGYFLYQKKKESSPWNLEAMPTLAFG